jgi:hypothetical protein
LTAPDKNRLPWDYSTASMLLMAARALENVYRHILEEPIPDRLAAILRELDEQETAARPADRVPQLMSVT